MNNLNEKLKEKELKAGLKAVFSQFGKVTDKERYRVAGVAISRSNLLGFHQPRLGTVLTRPAPVPDRRCWRLSL